MVAPVDTPIRLPDPEEIRVRLDRLQEERTLLRELLRIIIRIEGQQHLESLTAKREGTAHAAR